MALKLDFNNFYYWNFKGMVKEIQVAPENYREINSEELKGYCSGIFPKGKPQIFVQTAGGVKQKPRDIVVAKANMLLVRQEIIDELTRHHFTGWESYPIKWIRKNGEVIENYHAFSITGTCGDCDLKKSKIVDYEEKVYEGRSPYRSKCYKGYYFPKESWDGTDIFTRNCTGFMKIVKGDVKEVLEQFNVECEFVKLTEFMHKFRQIE